MDVYQRRRLVALSAVVGVFVIVVLAVAGGGDEEDATPATAVTGPTGPEGQQELGKRAYITQADRICAEANASLEAIDATDLEAAAETEARTMSGMLQQLRALPPPSRDAPLANRYLRALRTQVEALRDRQVAIEREDDALLTEADGRLAAAETEAQEIADAFGFEVCGNPEATTEQPLDEAGAPIEPAPADPAAPEAPAEPAPEAPAAPAPPPPPPPDPGDGTGGVGPGGTGGVGP